MKRAWIPVFVLTLLVLLPDVAHACAVCFDPREENRFAFLATTAFLTLFPLSLVGMAGMILRKRSRELDEEERSESEYDDDYGSNDGS
jgi:amino acid transporter